MGQCAICQRQSKQISGALGLCAGCILADTPAARAQAAGAHARSRRRFQLPVRPPDGPGGVCCDRCVNACRIDAGEVGFCGARRNEAGQLTGGDEQLGAVQWYHDPLPTNCVADWVCPASGPAGHPAFTDTRGPEREYTNLAVFYEACSFDCLFCQNWHFKSHSVSGPRHSARQLADAVTPRTRCVCFFGGDPSCQVEHALAAAGLARKQSPEAILRICWETNGSMSRRACRDMVDLSLESGGCIKFDLKAWDDSLHRALCGTPNRRTLDNFRYVAQQLDSRPDPPLLVASTLLVSGYVDANQVSRIADFIAGLDPSIPYALLGFQPAFEMDDLPPTSWGLAEECLAAARKAGLTRVRIGNPGLLS